MNGLTRELIITAYLPLESATYSLHLSMEDLRDVLRDDKELLKSGNKDRLMQLLADMIYFDYERPRPSVWHQEQRVEGNPTRERWLQISPGIKINAVTPSALPEW